MNKTWIVALVCALALGACGCGSGGASTKTASVPSSTAVAPTATAIPVAVPPRPVSFTDYASTIAQFLTADSAAGGKDCLAALFAAWDMPLISATDGCLAA